MTNPYATLGVSRDSSQDEIKKAFKKLARKYHPDISKDPGAEQRFKEVNAAYDAVGDPEKRKLFDEFGEASLKPGFDADKARAWSQAAGGFPGSSGGVNYEFQGMDMEEFLSSIFSQTAGGRQGPRGRPIRGADQRLRVTLDPILTFLGGEHPIAVRRPNGSVDRLTVRIPAGAKDGGKLKLQGQGLPPRGGGPCGDLILELRVVDHPILRRRGDDLEMDVPITVLEAMKGARITVPTPTGDVKVTIPSGAESGTRMRLRGKGVQKRGRPGDLYLVLLTQVPDGEDPALEAAAQALEAGYSGDLRAGLKL